ncbi:hypothetical protein KFK09_005336 [Dendrobium nobile]|uniref:Uncharacterized protein n=1 Tax=Dendrobium nobile TaxID=94219 RepID=A0A8T3BVJ2_DENNO|nr:hypothetical protein KFK09_005336 [Dendrobium nobile]
MQENISEYELEIRYDLQVIVSTLRMPNSLVDRATSDMLIGPDWAMNLEICDVLNHDPGQIRDFVKGLKKRIKSKNSKVQLLALTLLETAVKSCSDMVHMQIVDKDIPHEMVKIAKKKPDFHVKEKILVLIDTWQEAFGGPQGRYPQFFMAYHELLRAGVVFPKRPVKSTPIFRSATSYPHSMRKHDNKTEKLEASSDSEIHFLRYIDVKQEVIVELVEKCRLYRQRVVHLVNSTSDEKLLREGLALNDDLQNVLTKYDAIVIEDSKKPKKKNSLHDLVDLDFKNQDADNESHRRSNAPLQQLLLPAPPGPNDIPITSPRSCLQLDLLSGEEFNTTSIDNSLALVPANETTAPSANDQNMPVLTGIYSPRNCGNNCTANIAFQAEQDYTVASLFQQQQQSISYLDGSAMNHGEAIHEHASFVQKALPSHGDPSWNNHIVGTQQQARIGEIDQGGALPPPPWEIELAESSQPLTIQQQHFQNEQTQEIITYSTGIQRNQPMGMFPPHDQAYHLLNAYSQSMQGYNYGQQSESHSYSNTRELSHKLNGLGLQDSYMNAGHYYQMPSTSSSSYLQQRFMADDNLFGDLVSIAKSKTNRPAK